MPSPAADDYLKTVYAHTEWQPSPITPSQLAAKLGIAPSSVTEMVKKLAAAGLVSHVPYGAVRLTEDGEQRALAVVRRHRLIETWLVREFGYAWDEVHDEAEVLEHTISDRLLEGIDARLDRPRFDPHGDAIPDASGAVIREPFVLLADAPDGHIGRILRVSDRDPALLRALESAGVQIGGMVTAISGGLRIDGTDVAPADGETRAEGRTDARAAAGTDVAPADGETRAEGRAAAHTDARAAAGTDVAPADGETRAEARTAAHTDARTAADTDAHTDTRTAAHTDTRTAARTAARTADVALPDGAAEIIWLSA